MASIMKLLIVFLATAIVLSSATTKNDFCENAKNKVLCCQLVIGAKTWPKAMTNAINETILLAKRANHTYYTIDSKLPPNLPAVSIRSLTSSCKEFFDLSLERLKNSLGVVTVDDPYDTLGRLITFATFAECGDNLETFGIKVPELTKFYNDILEHKAILFSIESKKPIH